MVKLMKIYLDCLPCFLKQTVQAGHLVTDDEGLIRNIVNEVAAMIPYLPENSTPPEIGEKIHRRIREITGMNDPYSSVKQQNIEEALLLYPDMKKLVRESSDPLFTAVKVAIAGNIIDFGTGTEFDITTDIHRITNQEPAINDIGLFKESLEKAESILYLGDNAGESVFDRILIEELKKPVTYIVRGIPVLNDVTYEDAVASGLDDSAFEIISSGTTAPGTVLPLCSANFINLFNKADMVISKGQGNYEGLSDVNRPVFFLLKAKCAVIARDIGVYEGDTVVKGINF